MNNLPEILTSFRMQRGIMPLSCDIRPEGFDLPEANIQARKFHHPANHPQIRPHFGPGVIEAQWYTPALLGILEASSASEAATSQ